MHYLPKFLAFVAILVVSILIILGSPPTAENKYYDFHTNSGLHTFMLEEAITNKQKMKGLMYRENLLANSGMIFIYQNPVRQSFWMKNTLINLDLILLDSSYKVVEIIENMQALSEDIITPKNEYSFAIELAAGKAKHIELAVGDQVSPAKLNN